MKIRDLSLAEFRARLGGDGIRLATGPFNCRLQSGIPELADELARLYAHHPLIDDKPFIDFHVGVQPGHGLRRWIAPQARFIVDAVEPFTPLPRGQALPMLEWGLNWCVTAYCHHILVIHAASVARGKHAAILPAPPGSGKSTLCAALVNRGWRLLSDELTLIRLDTGQIMGLARPVNLKNASIDIIRTYAPDAFLTRPILDTTKGTVALMAPTQASVEAVGEWADPAWMVLPRYRAGADATLTPMGSGTAFMQLADNAMNYHVLGARGFKAVGDIIERTRNYSFEYSRLDDAIAVFDRLAAEGMAE
ncbi:MAG: HprK-related kinase A [Proteobacteria bacterium]|nr:HprK-related kinase A [Pseudomonadota bacterium]